ncbi:MULTISPECIES: GNAT family N-acetyltransferase [unclassified Bradyrhizobium]|uniref:GNAT family N-acetyltransferase n=1 Tax=unclassified Bradyrhizobium TaxID=2631580 RepID=UPI0029160CDC|nr:MULTISPECIES: GNAT family N-acetyltransferase [unclassified Bradyrhizobium]
MRNGVNVSLAPVSSADLREVDTIFDELIAYSQHVDGVLRRDNAAYEFVTALPSGYEPCHKHAFLAKCQGVAVGLLDIFDGYPAPAGQSHMTLECSARRNRIVNEAESNIEHFRHSRSDFPYLLPYAIALPVPGTAFIGLLAVRESAQESGVGRALFREAERFARDDLRARTLRLAVVETNPVMGFWMKMGSRPTGEVKPFEGEVIKSRSALMEKEL